MAKFIFDKDYLIYESRIKNVLNADNIEKTSKYKIDRLRNYLNNDEYFDIYSENLIEDFKKKYYKNNSKFIRRYVRIHKKLSIDMNELNESYINKLRARLLSSTRNFKRISYSFEGEDFEKGIKRICYFNFPSVQVMRVDGIDSKYLGHYSFLIFNNGIVIYDETEEKYLLDIHYNNIISLNSNSIGNLLKTKEDTFLLIYKDPELIKIAMNRMEKEGK